MTICVLRPTLARLKLMAILSVVLAGCSADSDRPVRAPEPAQPIDVARFYTGRWYEIARTPMKLTDGCVAGTTDFVRDEDGGLVDRDACRDGTPAGSEETFRGPITILDPGTNAKFTTRYRVFGIFHVPVTYWVLDHDADYSWFIIADPPFQNLSLFTRDPRPSHDVIGRLNTRARELGYDTNRLEYPTQFPPGAQ